MRSLVKLICCIVLFTAPQTRSADSRLPSTALLTTEGDLSAQMVAGIDQFLMREIDNAVTNHAKFWHRDFSSREAYDRSVETNRARLRQRIGAVDPRVAEARVQMEHINADGF